MSFVNPLFLFGLFAILIPVIIHLFRFRRFRKVYFTNVRFLREIRQDTRNRSRLKHLLVLAARILAITFLVLAFAQPYIPAPGSRLTAGTKRISVYIDNSFSMDAVSSEGDLLEVAKRKAREIAMAYRPSDLFQLLTNEFDGRSQRLVSRDAFLERVDAVKRGAVARPMSEVLVRQADALGAAATGGGQNELRYVLSDFQKTVTDLAAAQADSLPLTNLVPVQARKRDNVYIDTCYFTQPFLQINASNELVIRIRNSGDDAVENVPVSFRVNGIQRAVTSTAVEAHAYADCRLSFTLEDGGWKAGEVSITDYPVVFDDTYYLSFHVRPSLNVLLVGEQDPGKYLHALFSGDPYFRLSEAGVNQVNYASFPSQQLIILDGIHALSSGFAEELNKYVSHGGSLIIFPSGDADLASYQSFLSSCNSSYPEAAVTEEERVASVETTHPLLQQVFEARKSLPANMDLPVVHRVYRLSNTGSVPVMKLGDGSSFLAASDFGNGHLYLFAVPADETWSSLPRHALFVPLLLKAAMRNSSEISAPLVIGGSTDFTISDTVLSGDQVLHLRDGAGKLDVIPDLHLRDGRTVVSAHDQVAEAGTYSLFAGDERIALLSFNYDRKESNLDCYTPADLETLAASRPASLRLIEPGGGDLSRSVAEISGGKRLWKACIWAVLFFLAAEVLLLRFMKPR
jgi:hypothetical protein